MQEMLEVESFGGAGRVATEASAPGEQGRFGKGWEVTAKYR